MHKQLKNKAYWDHEIQTCLKSNQTAQFASGESMLSS